jgi:hypothetical protein
MCQPCPKLLTGVHISPILHTIAKIAILLFSISSEINFRIFFFTVQTARKDLMSEGFPLSYLNPE